MQRVLVSLWVLAVIAFAISAAQAHAAKEPQPQPPPRSTTRYGEDYTYLHDPAARTGAWWEPFKYLPLTGTKGIREVYLTTGLELRARYEHYNNNLWGGASEPHDGYLWLRAMPLVDLHLGSHVRLFGQLIAAFADGVEPVESPVDEDRLDLLQGFADLRLPLGTGTAGAWDQNLMTEWHVRYGGPGVMIYWHVERHSVCIYLPAQNVLLLRGRCYDRRCAAALYGHGSREELCR